MPDKPSLLEKLDILISLVKQNLIDDPKKPLNEEDKALKDQLVSEGIEVIKGCKELRSLQRGYIWNVKIVKAHLDLNYNAERETKEVFEFLEAELNIKQKR